MDTVATPALSSISKLSAKLSVAPTPIVEPLFSNSTPEPVATTPVRLLPSITGRTPVNCSAFICP